MRLLTSIAFLMPAMLFLLGCVDKNVRLYVELDDSCSSCCNDLEFKVTLDKIYFGSATLEAPLLVEQPIGTTTEIAIAIAEDDTQNNHPDRCAKCINSSINNTIWRTEIPEDANYAYYNRLFIFENEDIHLNITCRPFPSEIWEECDRKACWSPPQNQCIAPSTSTTIATVFNTMLKYAPRGVCTEGECRYPSVEEACSTGYCDANGCISRPSCENVFCLTPPKNRCADDETLALFSAEGYCNGGQCYYHKREVKCDEGCVNGHCVESPCQGRFCLKPPAAHCLDDETLRIYNPIGHCSIRSTEPKCQYNESDITCPYGCFHGECVAASCIGTPCITPPSNYCEYKQLIAFAPVGNCENGYCHYPSHIVDCGTCEEGQCDNPCIGVTCNKPPAPYCIDDKVLKTYKTPGICSDGGCRYLGTKIECTGGCKDGRCTKDPCTGVTCMPPSPYCNFDTVVTGIKDGGRCEEGVCYWETDTHTCENGCEKGVCVTEPCQGIVCNTPPSNHCIDDNTFVEFAPIGECSGGGTCLYDTTIETCKSCANGYCVPEV